MTDAPIAGTRPLAAVVLAAGKGTRMRSAVPKVLHEVLGRSVLGWVLASLGEVGAARTVVVVGHGAEQVTASLPAGVSMSVQEQQRGSGDALAAAMPALEGFEGDVLVVNGDGALFTGATLAAVASSHAASSAQASCLAIASDEQLPYGRVLIDDDGSVDAIIEAGDATPAQLAVRELNAGVYCFDVAALRAALPQLGADNSKGELYITDLLGIIRGAGGRTLAVVTGDPAELLGINTRADLAAAERILQDRINRSHMESGVTISQPHDVLIEPTVRIEPDATIRTGSWLRGTTTVAAGAVVGPRAILTDTDVDEHASITESTCIESTIGAGASVGPYAYLRPGTVMQAGSKAGTFVELKKTSLGARSKVPHLSYIGDATIGADTNIGAGNITANYRPELGAGKQATRIGTGVRTGSDNVFVAPVAIGDGAYTGAGSIIVNDVPAGALAIARARQVNLQDYAQRLTLPAAAKETTGEQPHRPDADAIRHGIPDARG